MFKLSVLYVLLSSVFLAILVNIEVFFKIFEMFLNIILGII